MCVCGNRPFAPRLFTYVLVDLIRLWPTTDARGRPDTVARSVVFGPHLAHSPAATGGAGAAGSSLVWPTSPGTEAAAGRQWLQLR